MLIAFNTISDIVISGNQNLSNVIFGDMFTEIASETDLVTAEQVRQFARYKEKVKGIMEILKRDRMKVAFFGR